MDWERAKEKWHMLWHLHFERESSGVQLHLCVRRIWWWPWRVCTHRIGVYVFESGDEHVVYGYLNFDQVTELLEMHLINDMRQFIMKEGNGTITTLNLIEEEWPE